MNRLSVIIPIYNAEAYLRECLNSVSKELDPFDEIILINDGSLDGSLDICREYESDNIIVIDNENLGVSHTRNCGIAAASGEYIMFVDSDDYLLNGWRKTVQLGIESGSDVVFFSQNENNIPERKEIVESIIGFPQTAPLDIKAGACWYKLFKTEYIKSNGILFDCALINGEDGMFNLCAILAGADYTLVKGEGFYYYRLNNASATHSFNEGFYLSNLKYISDLSNVLHKSGLFEKERIEEYISFVSVQGLYLLACRIALLEDKAMRQEKYRLLDTPEYKRLYSLKAPEKHASIRAKAVFGLLKKEKYDGCMRFIRLYNRLYNIIRKVLKH